MDGQIRREDVEGVGATAGTMVGGCRRCPERGYREFGRGRPRTSVGWGARL